jgi:hypothetical protein
MRSFKNLMTYVISILIVVSTLNIPATAVKAGENTNMESDPVKAEYLLDEGFSFTSLSNNNITTYGVNYLPSGWDIQAAGGVLTGGYYSSNFKITDTSKVLPVTMNRKFKSQSSGKIILEYRFKIGPTAVDGIKWQLRSGNNVGVNIYSSAAANATTGNIYIDTAAGSSVLLQGFTANTEYGVKAIVDITNKKADVYINGTLKASEVAFKNAVSTLDNFYVSTGVASTGDLNLLPIKIYKGYTVNERFVTTLTNLPKDWAATLSGGVIAVENMSNAPQPDPYGLKLDATNSTANMSLKKTIPAQTGALVFEYKALFPQKVDGISAIILNGNTNAFKMVTADGKFCYVDSTGQAVPVYDYIPNLWYSFKIKLDTTTSKADIYINGKLKKEGADFAATVSSIDGISYSTDVTKKGIVKLDDILLYNDLPLPADYVPAPVKVSTGDTLVGIQSCSMWKEGTHMGWDRINPYPDRKPLLGYYDEGSPEEADWEIKWMAEHGIAFQMYCWFRNGTTKGNPIKDTELASALNDGYFNAKYSDQVKFMIQWESSNGNITGSADFRNNVVPYWMEYYIKDPRYLVIDNKPVISIYNYKAVKTALGNSSENVKIEMDYLRQVCKDAGFDGVILLTSHSSTDSALLAEMKSAGFDDFYAYSHVNITGEPEYMEAKLLMQKQASEVAAQRLDLIPTLAMGRDDQPWGNAAGYKLTAQQFQDVAQWIKDALMPSLPDTSLGRKLMLLDNWNEYGEGHYILPTKGTGFGYIDAIRNVFAGGGEHQDALLTQNQLDRINVLYPSDRVMPQKKYPAVAPHTGVYTKQWEFNTDGALEGWDTEINQISSMPVSDGKLTINSLGMDPWMESPENLGFSANDNPYIHIRSKNNGFDISGRIYFITEADTAWSESKSVGFAPFPNDKDYRDYYIDMSTNAFWTGKVKQFRLDPMATPNSVDIDFIRVEYSPLSGVKTYLNGTMAKFANEVKVIDNCVMLPIEEFYKSKLVIPNQWNDTHNELLAVKDGRAYRLTQDQLVSYKDETTAINLEHAPVIVDGVMYAPASFVKQAFGYVVSWDSQAQELSIYTSEIAWNFNTNDGWTFNSLIVSGGASGGYYLGTSMGTSENGEEGYISSPDNLKIDSADIKRVRINYMNNNPGTELKLYFTTTNDPAWDSNKMIVLPAVVSDNSYREYVFDTSSFSKWSGIIKQIILVPTNAAGSFGIDYIKLDITPTLAVKGDNLIIDPNMELAANPQINGWATTREYFTSTAPGFAHSGKQVMKVTKTNGYGSIRFEKTTQVKGQEYYYSAWVKLDADSVSKSTPPVARLYLQYSVDGVQTAKLVAQTTALSTTEWKQLKGNYTINETGVVTGICFYISTDAPAALDVFYLDDVEVVPVNYTTSSGWTYVSGISLNKDFTVIAPGATEKLTASLVPLKAINKEVFWSTDNPSVATVDAYGYVYGKSAGRANIKVTTNEGGFSAVCEVVVGPVEIMVTNIKVSDFTHNSQGKFAIHAKNMKDYSNNITIIIGLFDKQTNKLIDMSNKTVNLAPGQEEDIETIIGIPAVGEYIAKCFVWDDMLSMKPLMNVRVTSVE